MANPFPFVAGDVLTAADMNGIGEWTSFTPTLYASGIAVTLGTGSTQFGEYARVQNLIVYRFRISYGTSGFSAGTGFYTVSIPVTASGATQFYENSIGVTAVYDASVSNVYFGNAWLSTNNILSLIYQTGFNGAMTNVSHSAPFTVAASDTYSGLVVYRAA